MNRGRRVLRVATNLLADRRDPPLDELERETDPERFLWRMLPHAARTFSLAIAVLPEKLARTVGVAYLCCRILDTAEDLARVPDERVRLLDAAVTLARDGTPIPEVVAPWVQDARDRAHLVLVRRSELVAQLLTTLEEGSRRRIAALVERMAAGMKRASEVRTATGGVIAGAERERYCRAVLAEPLLFAESEFRSARRPPRRSLRGTARDGPRGRRARAAGERLPRRREGPRARGRLRRRSRAVDGPAGRRAAGGGRGGAPPDPRARVVPRRRGRSFLRRAALRPPVGSTRRLARPADHDGAVLPARERSASIRGRCAESPLPAGLRAAAACAAGVLSKRSAERSFASARAAFEPHVQSPSL